MRIHVGSDHAGVTLRRELCDELARLGHEVVAVHGPAEPGERCDYPDIAKAVARGVAGDAGSLGLLVCGSGQGMAMTANRYAGVRAAVCSDVFSAAATRAHNDANILCLGERVIGVGVAKEVLGAFLRGEFEGGRHAARVAKIEPDA